MRPLSDRHQVEVLVWMLGDVAADEGTEREHLEPSAARLVERGGDQFARQPLPFTVRGDLGVDERDQIAAAAVLGETDDMLAVANLEPLAVWNVDHRVLR